MHIDKSALILFAACAAVFGGSYPALAAEAVESEPPSPPAPLALPSIDSFAANFKDKNPQLVQLFRVGLLNTKKQIKQEADGTIYVATGDIPAEWLRDSSAQIRPYLYFARDDKAVAALIRGVIARQALYLKRDPYANAFREDGTIWEQKFELDSLTYPVILAWSYYKVTGDKSIFTADFGAAMQCVLDTIKREQDHPSTHTKDSYWYTHESLVENGMGPATAPTGMVWTGFRPSDDNCKYNYLIPAEMMAVVALTGLEEIEAKIYANSENAALAHSLRAQINAGIQKYGTVEVPGIGRIYAYEVDGLGHQLLMDDANIPSLLSAPYLGYIGVDDPIYQNTRRFILSSKNANFASGKVAQGIGSEHTPHGYIWPLALIMEGLTTDSAAENDRVMKNLLASDPGDRLLHESFDANDQMKYTRPDFGWPNALFAEYVMLHRKLVQPLPTPDLSDLSKVKQ